MKKYLIALFFVQLFSIRSSSQNNYDGLQIPYDPCTSCMTDTPTYLGEVHFDSPNQVQSDFGPRFVNNRPYDWHGGIDYSHQVNDMDADKGFHLKSIVGGTVHAVTQTSSGLKAIIIDGQVHDFGYIHIFDSSIVDSDNNSHQTGDCKFVRLDNTNSEINNFGILVPNGNQYDLIAECPDNNCEGRTYTDTNGMVYNAQNTVVQGDIIGVLGDSGTGGAHLHLNRYESLSICNDFANCDEYMLDPLEYIEHTGVDYSCSFHNHKTIVTNPDNEPSGFTTEDILYPGTKLNTIMLRAQLEDGGMNNSYTSATFNINEVDLNIKGDHETSFAFLEGGKFYGKILMGATDSSNEDYPNYLNKTSTSSKGGWKKQGIFHFAYRDSGNSHGTPYSTSGARPYDDHYFPFYTRIRIDSPINSEGEEITFADTPFFSRYNDDDYELEGNVVDLRNNVFKVEEETKFNIDNFQPFVTKFKLNTPAANLINFQMNRDQDSKTSSLNDGIVLNKTESFDLSDYDIWLDLEVGLSEPMKTLEVAIEDDNGGQSPFYTMTESDIYPLLWTIKVSTNLVSDIPNVPVIDLSSGRCYKFIFKGKDTAGNELMDVYTDSQQNSPGLNYAVPIATRISATGTDQWTNDNETDGQDYFEFCTSCSGIISNSKGNQDSDSRISSDCDPSLLEFLVYSDCNGLVNIAVNNSGIDNIGWLMDGQYVAFPQDPNNPLESELGINQGLANIDPNQEYCYVIESAEGCCRFFNCVDIPSTIPQTLPFLISTTDHSGGPGDAYDLSLSPIGGNIMDFPITAQLFDSNANSVGTKIFSSEESIQSPFIGLGPGSYCIIYSDGSGCEYEHCFTLEGNSCDDNYFSLNGLHGDGSIELQIASIVSDAGCIDYEVLWDNGETSMCNENLCEGEHCVTISFTEELCKDCKTVQCWDVEREPLGVTPDVNEICVWRVISEFGEVEQLFYGSVVFESHLSVLWDGDMPESSTTNSGIEFTFNDPGEYCYTVTDGCTSTTGCVTIELERYEEVEINGWIIKYPKPCRFEPYPEEEIYFKLKQQRDLYQAYQKLEELDYPDQIIINDNLYLVRNGDKDRKYGYVVYFMGKAIGEYDYTSIPNDVAKREMGKPMKKPAIDNSAELTIYPNPFTQVVNLTIDNSENLNVESEIQIFDFSGRLVFSRILKEENITNLKLDLGKLDNGTYILRYENPTQIVTKKIIKIE